MQDAILKALRNFADAVKARFSGGVTGEPEAQLSAPVSALLEAMGPITSRSIVCKAESHLQDRLGIPDFGVEIDGALCGYIELKAPGAGADTAKYKTRNKAQWERFKAQPNIIYTDGQEWCLYQNGEPAERLLRFSKDIKKHGAKGVSEEDVEHFRAIITRFTSWDPIIPENPKDQASLLAPLCRLLREDVKEALVDPESPLNETAKEWRQLLFPDADNDKFADSYAQTVTFALLLARSERADVSHIDSAVAKLEPEHTLLARALRVLTDTKPRKEIEPSLRLLQRVINAFPEGAMRRRSEADTDPWLYFYEHFLAAYDPKLRKDSGVYYTPVEVVQCQVALVDDILRNKLNRPGGFSHKSVITLDPAVGTGTYLLGVIDHALERVEQEQGQGAVPAKASALAGNLYGFELMTGPYAVTELRLTRALKDREATLPDEGVGVYLADTLESPFGDPPKLPQFYQPIAEQHAKALHVKDKKAVIVCLGNPPYDRHEAVKYAGKKEISISDRARTGGWVRWGDSGNPEAAILSAFIEPARQAGHGGDLKNLYNLYVYFWRWAIWKVFEHTSGAAENNPGIVTFITASSYIRGDAFVGMREMLRRVCDEVYIIDLGGEGRGTRQDDNVFNIQTPVAICIAVREGKKDKEQPATAQYTSIHGSREEKYARLSEVRSLADLHWASCPSDWHGPLRPKGTGPYFEWPLLTDLMPWPHTGVETKRPWPICIDANQAKRRWRELLQSSDRARALKESGDRNILKKFTRYLTNSAWPDAEKPIAKLTTTSPVPPVVRYAYRILDRQCIIADYRLISRPRAPLWFTYSASQLYLSSMLKHRFGHGPAMFASADVFDRHHFRGSYGGQDNMPLYRDAEAGHPNILPGFLELWGKRLKRSVTPEAFAAYVYALLGHGAFVERFWGELEDCELRVPITLDAALFDRAVELGSRLLFMHTYGERFAPKGKHGQLPKGSARVIEAISDKPADYPEKFEYLEQSKTLRVGTGAIAPVEPEVWGFEVSGLQVVAS